MSFEWENNSSGSLKRCALSFSQTIIHPFLFSIKVYYKIKRCAQTTIHPFSFSTELYYKINCCPKATLCAHLHQEEKMPAAEKWPGSLCKASHLLLSAVHSWFLLLSSYKLGMIERRMLVREGACASKLRASQEVGESWGHCLCIRAHMVFYFLSFFSKSTFTFLHRFSPPGVRQNKTKMQ